MAGWAAEQTAKVFTRTWTDDMRKFLDHIGAWRHVPVYRVIHKRLNVQRVTR